LKNPALNPSANSEHPVLIVSQLGALKARIHVIAKDRMDSISRIIDLQILLIYILRLIILSSVIEVN